MKKSTTPVSALDGINVLFPNDLRDLAAFILRANIAQDTPTQKGRQTLHGLARSYSMICRVDSDHISEILTDHGLPLGNTIDVE